MGMDVKNNVSKNGRSDKAEAVYVTATYKILHVINVMIHAIGNISKTSRYAPVLETDHWCRDWVNRYTRSVLESRNECVNKSEEEEQTVTYRFSIASESSYARNTIHVLNHAIPIMLPYCVMVLDGSREILSHD